MTVTRCVNLDWLEVACLEPKSEPRNLWFWQKAGFEVHQRDYGTRVFGEVLTLYDTHGEPFLEIRRAPKTSILIPEYCTLRLVNRYCYFDNYYIKMMVAWYFATALAKRYDESIVFIEERRLDYWTHKKAIQKALESYRVSDEHKEYLKTLR